MEISPYLNFKGQCEEAFKFYEQMLGGKIVMMSRFAGTPGEAMVPPEFRDKIIHARIQIGSTLIMGSDTPPDRASEAKGFAISLQAGSVAEAERLFTALSRDGQVGMPFGKTFFAERFGMLKDRFGIPWMVICELQA